MRRTGLGAARFGVASRVSSWPMIVAIALPLLGLDLPAPAGPALGARDGKFTIDGTPTFLLGVSYYGGLGASEDILRRDLDEIRRLGFNWIRVWATWNAFDNDVSAVDADGKARKPFLGKLRRLVEECGQKRIVVDVTLSRGNGKNGANPIGTIETHRRAVETVVGALKDLPGWYLDLSNERNIRDKRFTSLEDLRDLRETVRRLDPSRLVTASQGGDIDRDELRAYLETVKVDFITPHRQRDANSPAETESRTREYIRWMGELGKIVPVHYQEPIRRGYADWAPRAEDFITDLRGAITGGAAGWCLHNGGTRSVKDERPRRSFDLREKSLFDQLDAEEKKAAELLAKTARK